MAVLDHVGVDHLVSKISEKISNVEGLTNEAYDLAGEANSMATTANDKAIEANNKAEDALKRAVSIEIHYTTSDNQPLISAGTNNYVLSDTYENGEGVIVVDPSVKILHVGILGFINKNRLTSLVLPQNHFHTINSSIAFSGITGLTHFEVPDSVTTIPPSTFISSHLETIKLGNGLTGITDSLFTGCVNLEQVVIPDSVKYVETNSFSGCTSLTSITFGSGITGITGYAVISCPNIERIYMRSTTPPNISSLTFGRGNNNTFKFYVPLESVDAYKQAVNWSAYADRIVGIVFEDENIVSGENIKTINGQSLLGSGNIEIAQPVYPYYLPVTMSEINNCLGNNSSGQIEYDYDTYYEEIKGAILSEREIRIDNDDVIDGGFYVSIDPQVDDYIYITFASSEFIFSLSFEEDYVHVYRTEMASGLYVKSFFLPLSGGTMNGNLVTKQINVEAGNWVVTNGNGLMMQRSDGPSYIWNKATGHSISIGTKAIGDTSELNASLNIKGNDVYPGPNGTINLGIDAHTFNNIKGNSIHGKKFIGGNYTRSDFINSLTTGLQISTNIQKSDNNTAGDYGFPASNNANGVLSFRVHNGNSSSLSDYCHYLGFSQKGLFYRNNNATSDNWVRLNNPSIFQPSAPLLSEYTSASAMIPEIIHDNITNVFHDIQQTKILIERSQDGTTWVDTTETDFPKFRQVMSTGKAANNRPVVAYDGANGQVGDRVRITINGACAYAKLAYIYVYYTTQGATTKLTVEKNTYSAQDTWVTIVDKEKVTGWSGPNYYGLENSIIGQTNGNNGYSYRLTFEITAISSGVTNVGYLDNIWAISSDRPWSITADPNKMFYFNVGRWKHVTNKSIEPLYDVTYALGSSSYRWSSIYSKDFYGILHTPNGTNNHFVKGNGSISTQVYVTHDAASASPLHQAICVSSAAGTDDITKMPGIGFHNPGKSYATLKYTGTFEFMNETLTGHKNVKAAKFITTGGVSSQFVKGDGSLDSTKYVTEEQLIEVEEVTAAALTDLAENKVDTSELSNYMPKTGGTFTDTVYGTTFNGTLVGAIYNATW